MYRYALRIRAKKFWVDAIASCRRAYQLDCGRDQVHKEGALAGSLASSFELESCVHPIRECIWETHRRA